MIEFSMLEGRVYPACSKGRVDMRAAMDDPSLLVYVLGLVIVRMADLSNDEFESS
jgi:hypothetical protein